MTSPNRINLVIAGIVACSVLTFLALTLGTSEASQPNKTLKSRMLRRADHRHESLSNQEIEYLQTHSIVQEQPAEERQIENKIPSHLPIKVKLRAEKEKAAKDLANERWHRDLELEIKNTGEKPIYYLSIIVQIPEITLGGNPVSVHIRYGEHSLFDDSKGRANADDVPIQVKQTIFLGLDEESAKAWEQWQKKEEWLQPKNVVLEFEEMN